MSQPTLTVEDRRVYIKAPYGHPCITALKELGAHGEYREGKFYGWWISTTKKAEVEAILARTANQAPAPDTNITVLGKARYKGRDYYVRWVGTCKNGEYKARLCTLDGKLDFWVKAAQPHDTSPPPEVGRVVKLYQEPRTLSSLQRFIEERRQEEDKAKQQPLQVQKMAQAEETRRIPNLTDGRMIRAFFGDRAAIYDYEVTHDQFDEDDNEGPGVYVGVTVPASLADRWDAGIRAARQAGHKDMRSREALLLRYQAMHGEEAVFPEELEQFLAERENKCPGKVGPE
jgi:hypothetical protein